MADIEPLDEELPSDVFERSYNRGLVHQAVVTYRANQRVDLATAKDRSEVAGANSKPWAQKGTGRARHGSRISPLWVGGGRAHGPDGNQNHGKKMTRKMKRKALYGALSERRREGRIYRCDPPPLEQPSTGTMHDFFEGEGYDEQRVLLLLTPGQKVLRLSTRNLPYCTPFDAESLNTYQVVAHNRIMFTPEGLDAFLGRVADGT